jgi:hypothetical protein
MIESSGRRPRQSIRATTEVSNLWFGIDAVIMWKQTLDLGSYQDLR